MLSKLESPFEPLDAIEKINTIFKQEIIILVGSPASGKSTFCKNYLQNYIRINQDTLGTLKACENECEKGIKNKKSIVIDNTNRFIKNRKIWIDIGKKYNLPIRCFYFNNSKDLIFHLNMFRHLTDSTRIKIPTMVIHSYYKQLELPLISEGFNELVTIRFSLFLSNDDLHLTNLIKSFLL